MQYILNSAVLTDFGRYTYIAATQEEAYVWLTTCECDHSSGQVDGETCRVCQGTGFPWQSTIGYPETAAALEALMGFEPGTIPVNRRTITMRPGDQALVFRIVLPPGTPRIAPEDKGRLAVHMQAGHWELGILRREV